MRNYYSDPTANAAIGSADGEFKEMVDLALRLRELKRANRITPEKERLIRRRFSGTFSVLLEDDFLDKIEEERKNKAKN
ncbi:MAG: hypothetical protein E7633_10820 [Ruminococcaceae bacterium]|nr:hypothetical protein [Oscillospiraceae bacterium]